MSNNKVRIHLVPRWAIAYYIYKLYTAHMYIYAVHTYIYISFLIDPRKGKVCFYGAGSH